MARTLGAIVLVALRYGATFGRVGGLIAARLGALGSLLAAGGGLPVLGAGGFAACFICIHGLVALREPIEDNRRPRSGKSQAAPGHQR